MSDNRAMDNTKSSVCGGEWKTPRTCSPENNTCEYHASWEYLYRGDEIRFTISTKHTDTWTGIAFSNDEKMVSVCMHRVPHLLTCCL